MPVISYEAYQYCPFNTRDAIKGANVYIRYYNVTRLHLILFGV